MTILAELTPTTAVTGCPAAPTASAARRPPHRHSEPGDAIATTEQQLRQRHSLPSGHPDRGRLRTRAIEKNLPLANSLARRYAGRGELLDDLKQVAALALIKAVDGYDPNRQVSFAGYAVPSILGAIKRHFRDNTWGVRVARSTQELAHEAAIATDKLSQQHGRPPTPAELADHLHVNLDDLLTAIDAKRAYRPASLNAPATGADTAEFADLIDLIGGADPRYADVDDHLSLQPLLATLAPRERRIITLRFYSHMTQARIAAKVGLSQMHVSRLLRQSLARLRSNMPR